MTVAASLDKRSTLPVHLLPRCRCLCCGTRRPPQPPLHRLNRSSPPSSHDRCKRIRPRLCYGTVAAAPLPPPPTTTAATVRSDTLAPPCLIARDRRRRRPCRRRVPQCRGTRWEGNTAADGCRGAAVAATTAAVQSHTRYSHTDLRRTAQHL